MKHSDMVVDMMTVDWLYTDVHTELLKANTRTLMVKEPEEILVRLFPDETIKARSLEGQKLLANASDFRVTSDWGTNLVFKKDGRCANYQWGVSDSPGRWDDWPSGLVASAPLEESAEGVLVLGVGDLILGLGRYVSEPTRIALKDGRVRGIEGGVTPYCYESIWRASMIVRFSFPLI